MQRLRGVIGGISTLKDSKMAAYEVLRESEKTSTKIYWSLKSPISHVIGRVYTYIYLSLAARFVI